MRRNSPAGEEAAGRPAARFRTPESYINWERGFAIVAGMIGIVLVFFLLLVLLPIRAEEDTTPITGLASPPPTASPPPPAARAPATAPPVTGPDRPRLTATAREFPFVRKGPGVNFAVIMNLRQGQRVEIVGRNPDRQWYQIVLPDNPREFGWVSQEYLAVEGDVNTLPEVRE